MIETWENLQARLFHLGWLGEELPDFVATPGGGWLFRQIIREAQTVAAIAADYVAECEKAALTHPDQPAEEPSRPRGPVDTDTTTGGGGAA